jgi:hypothetical protein
LLVASAQVWKPPAVTQFKLSPPATRRGQKLFTKFFPMPS